MLLKVKCSSDYTLCARVRNSSKYLLPVIHTEMLSTKDFMTLILDSMKLFMSSMYGSVAEDEHYNIIRELSYCVSIGKDLERLEKVHTHLSGQRRPGWQGSAVSWPLA